MARWVCLRCFEPNEEIFGACQSCGLPRGERPAADDERFPRAADEEPSRTLAWGRRLARFWWVAALIGLPLIGLITNAQRGEDGQVTRAGTLEISRLAVGDCYDVADDLEEVGEVTARPCAEPHEYELMYIGSMSGQAYPSDAQVGAWLEEHCLPAFDDYIGRAYEASRLDIAWFQPSESGWEQGDRSMQCAVYDPADAQLVDALRNSRQ